ncbi:Putative NUDIX hydrolase domain, coenzyme A pyrophosphatase [Colletotrichum destructivum]|uniref:NUDIX hydrolase domain, coenzyme A pyrophosphatase n=1 Tax=Colletotrichum destructivum TaxID=34406 RepID=A0AAX4I3I0_9PEZI|nr:Putative NUDIX hydrolase domain, coenzyme A pyrophosphatase [Colletotrichum destructivum]
MSQAAATDPKPAPTSPPSFSEAAAAATTGTTTGTTSAAASPALQQHQQYQDQQPDEATPPTDQEVHEITAHLAAAAKHPSAATTVASFSSAAGTTAATSPTTPLSASNKNNDPSDGTVNPNPEGVLILDDDDDEVTSYWDAEAMAPLNPVSAAAISRLRRYVPPAFPLWDRLPVSRRAAVLILLYADRRGDLRVVITMRAASLRSFSGHAAFPGGKADTLQETPYEIARREAWEEIGLPMDDARIPKPFKIEPLCYLPYNLARTELVVRPCVAFLHADEEPDENPSPLVEERMIPRLDAKEVAAVFSAPFQNFLRARDPEPHGTQRRALPPGHWYDGSWIQWKEHPWRVHNFYVPVDDQRVTTPGNAMEADHPQSNLAEKLEEDKVGRFKVWGLTAHMLVDAARIAYGKEPEFECNSHFGDEEIILQAEREGSLVEKKRKRDESTTTTTTVTAGEAGEEGIGEGEKSEPAKM